MRTTVTLEPDTAAFVQRWMRERGLSFKEAINEVIRRSARADMSGEATTMFRTPTAVMGTPRVNLDRALQLAGELEDEELVRRSRVGK